jgi:hypothetical protein
MRSLFRVAVSAAGLGAGGDLAVRRRAGPGARPTNAGKKIRLLVGISPTAYGYDTYGRLLARYLDNYLPGHPLMVAEKRPGAPGRSSWPTKMTHAPDVIARAQAIAAPPDAGR